MKSTEGGSALETAPTERAGSDDIFLANAETERECMSDDDIARTGKKQVRYLCMNWLLVDEAKDSRDTQESWRARELRNESEEAGGFI